MTKVYYGRRCCGKTMKLIEEAKNYNGYIVCRNEREQRRISAIAKKRGFDINYPLTYQDFISQRYYSLGVRKFHIDDAVELIRQSCPVEVESITIDFDERRPNFIELKGERDNASIFNQ